MAFVANLFNTYPALELGELEEEIEPYEETREEKSKFGLIVYWKNFKRRFSGC